MNDFSELEAELKQLRPAAVSPELATRVERALAEPVTATATAGVLPRPKARLNWFALGLGVAAAAFFLFMSLDLELPLARTPSIAALTPAPSASAAQPASDFVPDGLTRVVYATRDEGLVFPENSNEPVRRMRSRSRETLQWKNPGTGASLRVSYPTEEVEWIPVSGQ